MDETPRCKRHNAETLLRCGKCEAPICPKCSVFGAVGARCPDCSFRTASPEENADHRRAGLVAGAVALPLAALGGFLLLSAGGWGLFGQFWIAALGGTGTGEAAWRISGRRPVKLTEIGVLVGAAVGVLAGWVVWCLSRGFVPELEAVRVLFETRPTSIACLVLLVGAAWARVRFRW